MFDGMHFALARLPPARETWAQDSLKLAAEMFVGGFKGDFASVTLPTTEVQPAPDAGPILPLSAHTPPWEARQGKPCGQRRRFLPDHGVAGSASFERRGELRGGALKTGAPAREKDGI